MRDRLPMIVGLLLAGILGSSSGSGPWADAGEKDGIGGETQPPGMSQETNTFSICAIDPERGECGVAVTTRVPMVGRGVPWVRAGVGAVATQAFTQTQYGPDGLDLLEQGKTPAEAIELLLADDSRRESRQLGIIDMQGRTAHHTGEKNSEYAGARAGTYYTVQGNLLAGREVIDAVAESFESTAQTDAQLVDRLISALEAGQAAGGDKRKGLKQSAAVIVATSRSSGVAGDHLVMNLHVAEHPTPVAELRRQYDTILRRLGYREFRFVVGRDVLELKRLLHGVGYFRAELERLPIHSEIRP